MGQTALDRFPENNQTSDYEQTFHSLRITLNTLFLIPGQSNATTNDSTHLKILKNRKGFLISFNVLYNQSTVREEEFNERTMQGGILAKILPNRRMSLGKYGNFSTFGYGKILYRKTDIEDFSKQGPSAKFMAKGEKFGLGIGSSFEFEFPIFKHLNFRTGIESCFDFVEFANENVGITISPFIGFIYNEIFILELGDDIEITRNTFNCPIAKLGILF